MNNFTASYKNNFIEAVILANKEIFTHIKRNISIKDYEYTNKIGFGGDNSLQIDLVAENIFIKYLKEFGNIYSEECGLLDYGKNYTIVIDPLDGSNNFYSNLPYFGTSVAIQEQEVSIAGFVTNLVTGEIIYRIFDEEIKYFSLLEMKEFRTFKIQSNKIAIFERAYEYPNICKIFNKHNIKFRSLGAVALSLSQANNYEFVMYAGKIREFDILAALYICKDLYIYQTNQYLFITKNKEKYDFFKEIINEF